MSATPAQWDEAVLSDLGAVGEQTVLTGPFGANLGKEDFVASGVPIFTIGCLGAEGIDRSKLLHVSSQKAHELRAYRLREGDFLFSRMASVGRVGFVPADLDGALFNYHLMRLRLNSAAILPKLFYYYVRGSEAVRQYLDAVSRGATRDGINTKLLRNMPVHLPPLPEQRRIVEKIDSLSAKSRRARANLDHIPRLVEKYKQAILATVFTHAGNKNDLVALSEVIASTFYGPRFAKDAYDSGGVMTLRTTDFDNDGNIRLKSPPAVQVSEAELAKWGLIDGDILVTRTGSIGKCAQYVGAIGPALPSAYLIRVRLLLEKVRPRYVLLFLLSETGQSQLGLGITAVTQPNINAGVIERLHLPVPSLDVQDKAIRLVETAFDWVDRLASETISARKLIDHLDQGILAKAFRGELVPQDPNDEPASVLLERIRTVREGQVATKRSKRIKK